MFSWDDVEDIVIAQKLRERAEAGAAAREAESLKDQAVRLQRQIGYLKNECHYRNAIVGAGREVAKHFIDEYVRLSGRPEAEVKQLASKLHAEALDRLVEESLKNGDMTSDSRKAPPVQIHKPSRLDKFIFGAFRLVDKLFTAFAAIVGLVAVSILAAMLFGVHW